MLTGVMSLRQSSLDDAGKFLEAAIPSAGVEAGYRLSEHALEGLANHL